MFDYRKYRPYPVINLPDRKWPGKVITKAPVWCSVDLRDGNQALEIPMGLEQKINLFNFLVKLGFKEIEVGFPAASGTEFLFTRELIERGLIPDDVTIQVLTQSREHIIEKTFEALEGVPRAIVHLYNSTSVLQREVVFGNSKQETIDLAVSGARLVKKLAEKYGRERFIFEYSPESFTGTEVDFAVEISNAVMDVWEPDAAHKAILNLPSTVEMATPNIYADQIEYMGRHIKRREHVIISLHTHNDRGTGVAASELALLAGGDRVEGTLFGNGERTGNADILTIAMNLYSQGIDPELDFSDVNKVMQIYEDSTGMDVHKRHPYAGDLVFTAFSGSHQDAINKGMADREKLQKLWAVPYLPIDPADVGRTYDPIIRINSQSGKGGVAYVLEQSYGLQIPKRMQQDFSAVVTRISDSQNKELLKNELHSLFMDHYVDLTAPLTFVSYRESEAEEGTSIQAVVLSAGEEKSISGTGNGLLDAFCKGLQQTFGIAFEIRNYSEHAMEHSSASRAITYIEIGNTENALFYGAGISSSVSKSSLKAVMSAVNNMISAGQ